MLGTHVGRCADELIERGVNRLIGEPLPGRRFGHTEINHLGHRLAVLLHDQNVRRLEIAVDDAFLMRVLDGLANLDEQFEPLAEGKFLLIAKFRDGFSRRQLHDEKRASSARCPRIEDLRDARVIHQRQRLSFGFETRDDGLRVHAQLDDFDRHFAAHWRELFRPIHDATTAFANFANDAKAVEYIFGPNASVGVTVRFGFGFRLEAQFQQAAETKTVRRTRHERGAATGAFSLRCRCLHH